MQFSHYFTREFTHVCVWGYALSKSTFGSLLKTKGVNYAKNSRSGVTWASR